MKRLSFLVFVLAFNVYGFGQLSTNVTVDFIKFDTEDKEVTAQKVFEFSGLSVEDIISKSESFAIKQFSKLDDIIQTKTDDKVVSKGFVGLKTSALSMVSKRELLFVFTVEAKEGRVRVTIDQIRSIYGTTSIQERTIGYETNEHVNESSLFSEYYKNNGKPRSRRKINTDCEDTLKKLFEDYKEFMVSEKDSW